jgi:hypothetical protein
MKNMLLRKPDNSPSVKDPAPGRNVEHILNGGDDNDKIHYFPVLFGYCRIDLDDSGEAPHFGSVQLPQLRPEGFLLQAKKGVSLPPVRHRDHKTGLIGGNFQPFKTQDAFFRW